TMNPHNDGLETAKGDYGYGLTNGALDTQSTPPRGPTATLYLGSTGRWGQTAPAGVFRWDGASRWTKYAPAPGGEGIRQLVVVDGPEHPVLFAVTVSDYETPGTGGHLYMRPIR